MKNKESIERVVLGGGCFWCLDPIFSHIKGVKSVMPGYAGGHTKNPTYEDVLTEKTGHVEVVRVEYDTTIIGLKELLSMFFSIHDPTTLNRQGDDVGTQYRSIILYYNDDQKEAAQSAVDKLKKEGIYESEIVTEIVPLEEFYEAEEYHHNYYEKNPDKAYCRLVITPKMNKFRKENSKYFRY
ncbi:peptide-methionine (S)-S-oxide reductase MsrA [Patescibacteria group bacterium]